MTPIEIRYIEADDEYDEELSFKMLPMNDCVVFTMKEGDKEVGCIMDIPDVEAIKIWLQDWLNNLLDE